jgi:uncharacterized membrane protein
MTFRADSARLEHVVGAVLRLGVIASVVCLAVGLGLSFADSSSAFAAALLNIGIIVLLLTPVARVVVSAAEYALQRDWVFVSLTLTVLAELVVSALAAAYGWKL